jgi:hypothetical protein
MKAFVMKTLDAVGFVTKPIPRPGTNDAALLGYSSIVLGTFAIA